MYYNLLLGRNPVKASHKSKSVTNVIYKKHHRVFNRSALSVIIHTSWWIWLRIIIFYATRTRCFAISQRWSPVSFSLCAIWMSGGCRLCMRVSARHSHQVTALLQGLRNALAAHVRECSLIKFTNRSSARRNWRSRAVTNSVVHFSPEWSFECDAIHAQSVREFLSEIALDKL